MRTRMNLVLEAVKEDRIEVRYVNTKGMEADGLSKSLSCKFLGVPWQGFKPFEISQPVDLERNGFSIRNFARIFQRAIFGFLIFYERF